MSTFNPNAYGNPSAKSSLPTDTKAPGQEPKTQFACHTDDQYPTTSSPQNRILRRRENGSGIFPILPLAPETLLPSSSRSDKGTENQNVSSYTALSITTPVISVNEASDVIEGSGKGQSKKKLTVSHNLSVREQPTFVPPNMNNSKDEVPDSLSQLRMLRDVQMGQIRRNLEAKSKRTKEKHTTVSHQDLDLARAPVRPQRPAGSSRPWADESPVTNSNMGEEYSQSPREAYRASNLPQPADTILEGPKVAAKPYSRWATKSEMKPDYKEDLGSNAYGSACPTDATQASNTANNSYGRLLNRRGQSLAEEPYLQDWEGNATPPPPDWYDRPRYNNNNDAFKAAFKAWISSVERRSKTKTNLVNRTRFPIVPQQILADLSYHPDGIGMIRRSETIGFANFMKYGYTYDGGDDHPAKYSSLIDAADFEKWDKLDMTDYENVKFHGETTEILVDNWLEHLKVSQNASQQVGDQMDEPQTIDEVEIVDYSRPKLNIYLRPATEADLEELARIYNLHVTQGFTPVESNPIGASEMLIRMNMVEEAHLPFIVAAKKNQRDARELPLVDNETYSRERNLPVKHNKRRTLTRVETLVGFCCAQDFTCPDYVEYTSADLELYVDTGYNRMGIGKCLLDRVLQICDRGHLLRTKCDFHCAQDIRHVYGPGGDRNVHKVYFQLRKLNRPKSKDLQIKVSRKHTDSLAIYEDAFDLWLKNWLEDFGFEVEGLLKKVGAKHGRYIDTVYLGRETMWKPVDGNVPPPDPRYTNQEEDHIDEA